MSLSRLEKKAVDFIATIDRGWEYLEEVEKKPFHQGMSLSDFAKKFGLKISKAESLLARFEHHDLIQHSGDRKKFPFTIRIGLRGQLVLDNKTIKR